tara:strand:- start:6010 stop:6918 length:909 start_codon:yes stop_codon:yes gene_type:complete
MKKILNALICLIGILGIAVGILEVASRFYFSKEFNISTTARKLPVDVINAYITRTRAIIPTNSEEEYVVFLGDSFTFGDTLPLRESYPKVFERCLQRRGSKIKVINAGVQGTGLIDHFQIANRFLNQELANVNIKRVILGITDNDQLIETWGFHPYDACPDLYPYSNTRFLHHHLFSAYYLDYLKNVNNHQTKDKAVIERTNKCLKRNVDQLKSLLAKKKIPLTTTFLADAVRNDSENDVTSLSYVDKAEAFSDKFGLNFIVINEVLKSLASDREIYSADDYHFNASTNAIIGEYLCEQIKL